MSARQAPHDHMSVCVLASSVQGNYGHGIDAVTKEGETHASVYGHFGHECNAATFQRQVFSIF